MKRRYLATLILIILLCCTACTKAKTDETITCKISIDCKTAAARADEFSDSVKKVIPADGVILESKEIQIEKGSTVYDVLEKACRENNIVFEKNSAAGTDDWYIEGISNLYQMDCGELSGWFCSVNGESLTASCNKFTVSGGDVIKWQYTCNMGEDL